SRKPMVTCSGRSSASRSLDLLTIRGRGTLTMRRFSFGIGHPLPYHIGRRAGGPPSISTNYPTTSELGSSHQEVNRAARRRAADLVTPRFPKGSIRHDGAWHNAPTRRLPPGVDALRSQIQARVIQLSKSNERPDFDCRPNIGALKIGH